MKVKKNIDIYLTSKRPVRTIDVVQFDTGVQLVFTLKDFTIPDGSSATLYVQKPSGRFVYQDFNITVAINTITIDLENQALTEYGEISYQVSIENGTDTVTTFTGMMIVQRSLKDSGAIKSGTVVRAFDELTVEKLAEFQARAETAANGVIATIPEDYTEMTAKVNESANAIKGKLSGAVVVADDVSPVEHYPNVKVHGKNLFDISKISVMSPSVSAYVSTVGDDYIIITTPNGYTSNGYCTISRPLKEFCPSLEIGKTYVVNAITASNSANIYLPKVGKSWVFGQKMIMTEDILNSSVTFYGLSAQHNQGVGNCKISNIQIEEGSTATEYTPYVDPSTVKVTAGGVTYTPNTDGTINGISSTVLADGISTEAEGITIECEYNKDTNKVISKLADALGITI